MINWNLSVICLCAILLAFLLFKTVTRKNKTRIVWRLLATILAVTSLACMALPVYFIRQENTSSVMDTIALRTPSSGITSITWPFRIKTGDKLFVQGSFDNFSSSKMLLLLRSFNTTLDSIYIIPGKNVKFQLAIIPKPADRTVYNLTVLNGKDTIEKEPVPVLIEQGEPLKILILASSPDFENKFLQNHLSQKHCEVVARTAISKNKYSKNFLNIAPLSVDRITPALLNKFNVLIADATELSALSIAELSAIQTQITNSSLGLIVKTDSILTHSSFYARLFALTSTTGSIESQVDLHFPDSSGILLPLEINDPLFVRNQPGTQPLVRDKQDRIFANSALFGAGKIVLTTLTNTYTWALTGKQTEYDQFWLALLDAVTPKKVSDEFWSISPALPGINNPVHVHVETNRSEIPEGLINGSRIFLESNYDLPYQWTGIYYPAKPGWQTGIQTDGNPFYWYAFDTSDWKNIRVLQTEAAKHSVSTTANKEGIKQDQLIKKEVPKFYFLLLFILSAGFLWFEERIQYANNRSQSGTL